MKKYFFISVLLSVFVLSGILRFYRLSVIPNGLNLDEVVMGFDANSILKTGRDQYGSFLPLFFRSHDDYKPPLIIYSQTLSIAILGLNALAVRAPSAIYGILAVVFTYLFVLEIFPKRKKVAMLAAFLLAISPWHLQFTRTAYEVGIQPFLTVSSLYFLISGFRKKQWWRMILAGILFALGPHLYTASRVFVPGLFLIVIFLFRKEFFQLKKLTVIFLVSFALVIAPAIYLLFTPAGTTRFKGTNIFLDPVPHEQNVNFQVDDWLRRDRFSASLLHPEKLEFYQQTLKGYFGHLRFDYLFLGNSDSTTYYVPNGWLVYIWELPFFVSGLYFLFKTKDKKVAYLLGSWILLAPVPASVTVGVPSAIRTTIFLPVLQIVSALGIVSIFSKFISNKNLSLFLSSSLTLLAVYFLSFYLHMYYVHAPIDKGKFWYTPYEQMIKDVEQIKGKYGKVIVSTKLDQPQSFFLYHTKYDPKTYLRKDGGTVSGSFSETRNHFDKYYFKPIDFGKMRDGRTLFVGRPDEFSGTAPIIRKYFYPDGSDAVWVVGDQK